jgi:SAM-dependent methyltransferase/methyltransferase-like protein
MDTGADATTETALRRLASAYDQMPYRPRPHALTRPAHIGAIAQLFGLVVPSVTTARVLDIGCAVGGNLIPLAAAFPEARFVGIDLSPRQISLARHRAEAAGLANIVFQQGSVTDVDAGWGAFDYIVCHGVYSWVPAEVRRAILRVTAERLTDTGVALVSYNVLPGWYLRGVAREAMQAHASQFDEPSEKLAQARAFLDFLKDHTAEDTPYGQVVRREAEMLATEPDDYVTHEFLEAVNSPCTVAEFVKEAERAGLGYLGDSEYHTVLPGQRGAEAAEQLRAMATDPVQLELYIDLLIGRTFRQSILMKPAAVAKARHGRGPSCMAGLHVAATFDDLPQTTGPGRFVFRARPRRSSDIVRTLTTESRVAARALAALSSRWPATATAEELTEAVVSDDAPREAVAAAVLDILFRLMTAGVLLLSTTPIRVGRAEATHPVVWSLARADASSGAIQTANLHHEPVDFDGPSLVLAPLLDGTRDRTALIRSVMSMMEQGTIELRRDGELVPDSGARMKAATEMVDSTIRTLASAALLS